MLSTIVVDGIIVLLLVFLSLEIGMTYGKTPRPITQQVKERWVLLTILSVFAIALRVVVAL